MLSNFNFSFFRLKRKGSGARASVSESHSEQQQAQDLVALEEKNVIRAARDILLLIQNDPSQAAVLARVLSLKRIGNHAMNSFLQSLGEMVEYSKSVVTLPYQNHITEIDSLCGSIFMTQKLKKNIRKIEGTLNEVRSNHE